MNILHLCAFLCVSTTAFGGEGLKIYSIATKDLTKEVRILVDDEDVLDILYYEYLPLDERKKEEQMLEFILSGPNVLYESELEEIKKEELEYIFELDQLKPEDKQ